MFLFVASLLLLGTLVIALYSFLNSRLPILEELWTLEGAELLAETNGLYTVKIGDEVYVYKRDDSHFLGKDAVSQVAWTEDSVALVQNNVLKVVAPSGDTIALATLRHKEYVVSGFTKIVVTSYPAEGGIFGEPWVLTAYSMEGEVLWQAKIPGAPIFIADWDGALAVASYDISAGCIPTLYRLNRETGSIQWSASLPRGVFRRVHVSGEKLVVVFQDAVSCVDRSGEIVWNLQIERPIITSNFTYDLCVIALWSNSPYTSRRGYISLLNLEGKELWSLDIGEKVLRLELPADKEYIIALCQKHMIILSKETGNIIKKYRLQGRPLSLRQDEILQEIDGVLRLSILDI
jgi:outer membrane protein assembly factor BamB